MLLGIANYYEADRRTAVAGEDIALGAVILISDDGNGGRKATTCTDSDSAKLDAGSYGIALKVSSDPLQVDQSTGVPTDWGTRIVAINSGDLIVECRKGTIMEYDPSLLDASLTFAGVTVGQELAVKSGKFCKADVAGAITSPVIARVYNKVNGKIRIELV